MTRSGIRPWGLTFSPEGRLFQVEYSLEAIKLGGTAHWYPDGGRSCSWCGERGDLSSLELSSIEKIVEIDRHIGCAMSGLTADAGSMIDHARVSSLTHDLYYDEQNSGGKFDAVSLRLALRFGEEHLERKG